MQVLTCNLKAHAGDNSFYTDEATCCSTHKHAVSTRNKVDHEAKFFDAIFMTFAATQHRSKHSSPRHHTQAGHSVLLLLNMGDGHLRRYS